MGLFSNKKKITVNVTVQPVFEESMIPNSVQAGVLKYIFDGDITNLSDSINEELIASIGIKANTGYNWAKNNDYKPGIPEATVKSNIDVRSTVLGIIANNVGQGITNVYYRFGPMNSLHYTWQWLVNTHGYNPSTNELPALSATEGFKCYLADMRATYTRDSYDFIVETYDTGVLDQLGPSPQSGRTPSKPYTALSPLGIGEYAAQPDYEVSDVAVDDYVTVTYEFQNAAGAFVRRGITLPITGISDDDYHQVRYVKDDGTTGFFTYLHASGTYPAIDAAYIMQYSGLGTYFPWVYFRYQNQRVEPDFDNDDTIYADCRKYASYLGINYDTISNAVHEDNEVDDVAQCILQVSVKPGDQNQSVIHYLFNHFSVLHENALSQMQMADNLNDRFLAFSSSPSQIQYIADRFFAQTLQFSGITKRRLAGKIAETGKYTSHYGMVDQNTQLISEITTEGNETTTVENQQPAYVYRYQVLDAVYEEIAVFGLRIDYQVHNKKGFGAGGEQPELLVPIDREIARTLSISAREQVISRGLYMLVNTVIIVKSPWYASSWFRAVLLVVAIVITILSLGQAWQTIVAAAALGTVAVVIVIVTMVLQYVVVAFAIKLFVKKFGPKVGMIAAVAAIAIGGYNAATGGSGMWAEGMVSLGNGLIKESNGAYQEILKDMYQEQLQYQEWATGQFDTLSDKREELGLDAKWQGLSGLDFVGLVPQTVFGESPTSYYDRTVHSGNIGVTSYDLIEMYHDYKLQLPKLSDTQELLDGDLLS